MLSYIYSDELLLENDLNLLFYVLYATKKYILPRLTQICVEHLKSVESAELVWCVIWGKHPAAAAAAAARSLFPRGTPLPTDPQHSVENHKLCR
ncbi:unnamed protein product [Trichobilharzia regenti]|nr:unnamed protein product [Trichobilharzia regenti]